MARRPAWSAACSGPGCGKEAPSSFRRSPRLAGAAGFGLGLGLVFGAVPLLFAARKAGKVTAGGADLHLPTGRVIPLAAGVVLTAADLPGVPAAFLRRAVAQVTRKPDNPSLLGIKNLSRATWSARFADGTSAQAPPGRSVRAASGVLIDFGPFRAEVR